MRLGNRPEELLRLLGDARRTALIANANDDQGAMNRAVSVRHEIDELKGIGLEPVELDLRQFFGHKEELREALAGFDLIYPRGGNVFLLRRAFRQSGADAIVKQLLAADRLVYSGYSAGPCILGPSLRGLEGAEDDPNLIPDGYEAEVVWEGLDVLPFSIAPHYRPDDAWTRRIVAGYIANHVPFIALRDGEALVVDGDSQRVVG
jgi:dipeptidase E